MKKPKAEDFNVNFELDDFPTEEEREDYINYIDALEKYTEYLENEKQN